jgi:hypothetical protein
LQENVFWDLAPCRHLLNYSHRHSPALIMEAIRSSETPVLTKNTRRKIPEDGFLHSHRRENLRSYKIKFVDKNPTFHSWWTQEFFLRCIIGAGGYIIFNENNCVLREYNSAKLGTHHISVAWRCSSWIILLNSRTIFPYCAVIIMGQLHYVHRLRTHSYWTRGWVDPTTGLASAYLIKQMSWRHMGEWKYRPNVFDLGARWWRVVNFTLRPLYPRGKSP